MKHSTLSTAALLCAGLSVSAQYYIPPDFYNDMERQSYGIWPNAGQLTNDLGQAVPEVSFYTTGALPRAYFRKEGSFSLVLATSDTLANVDTLRRLDITCVGTQANFPDPVV